MIARWEQGRTAIDALITERRLERVTPSREFADALLGQAHRHLETAAASVETDPTGSFQLGYDAARKASPRSSPTRGCDHAEKEPTPCC